MHSMTAKNHGHVYGQDKSKMASASIRIVKMLFDTKTTNPMYAVKDFATERRMAKVLCPRFVARGDK
ncbi:MAG: hypothetical protein NTX48_16910 [Planctomycetales bacterium]|nr:hypothetical protein [Planctomycetales bacterium]